LALIESVSRIEPARLEEPTQAVVDVVAELSAAAATLGKSLHPETAANLADIVRIANTYYSNLIEGHATRPKDIERALAGDFEQDTARRHLQIEAAAHVKLQSEVDRMAAEGRLPEPASVDFLRHLHREFYRAATDDMLLVQGAGRQFTMRPGAWRAHPEEDVAVGRHVPPSSDRVDDFMRHFESRYRLADLGKAARITAVAAAHHRFNYIHPFPDGNGRVSRLMSHAMAHVAGIGARGLWSVSRGLARGLDGQRDYKRMMDYADTPRQGDLDGRGNLSLRSLNEFALWFLRVCLDQVNFMSELFELDRLRSRLRIYVEREDRLRSESALLLDVALVRGQIERGEANAVTGLPERSARRVLAETIDAGLLASTMPKGPVSLRFPADALDALFPRLFLDAGA
jgi:Fic family protein